MERKAKRGKAFDKVNRQKPEERMKYMIILTGGQPVQADIDVMGLSKSAKEMIKAHKDDGTFTILTGYCNDPNDFPDLSMGQVDKEDMLHMCVGSLSSHFLELPCRFTFSDDAPQKLIEDLLSTAMKAMYAAPAFAAA